MDGFQSGPGKRGDPHSSCTGDSHSRGGVKRFVLYAVGFFQHVREKAILGSHGLQKRPFINHVEGTAAIKWVGPGAGVQELGPIYE